MDVALPSDGSLGAALLALVAQARADGEDAEASLRTTVRTLMTQIRDREPTA